jgi:hypothetical protein
MYPWKRASAGLIYERIERRGTRISGIGAEKKKGGRAGLPETGVASSRIGGAVARRLEQGWFSAASVKEEGPGTSAVLYEEDLRFQKPPSSLQIKPKFFLVARVSFLSTPLHGKFYFFTI